MVVEIDEGVFLEEKVCVVSVFWFGCFEIEGFDFFEGCLDVVDVDD